MFERNCSLLFWASESLWMLSVIDMTWVLWLEQKCSTCVKSVVAQGVHLCSHHLFSDATGQCSALSPAVKLNLMCSENYLKCWSGTGISYLSITPRRKANLNKLTVTWTIHFRLIACCWADFYSFHGLKFASKESKSASVSHNLLVLPAIRVVSPVISSCFAKDFSYSFSLKPDKASSGILTDLREHMAVANCHYWTVLWLVTHITCTKFEFLANLIGARIINTQGHFDSFNKLSQATFKKDLD